MPRTTLTKTNGTTRNPTAGVSLTMTAADVANGNQFALTGRELVVVQNTGGVGYTFTVTTAADERGRTKDITAEAIAAAEIRIFGPLDLTGWIQSDGMLYLAANNAAVKFGIIVIP